MVECYYNGYLIGPSIDKLLLKNGRIGLDELDNRYFLTFNSSKAISEIELTRKNEFYPSIPFQCGKKELKKAYNLEKEFCDDKTCCVKFFPRNEKNHRFSGEAWIDKETSSLLKINLKVENTTRHPFLPAFPADSLYHVDFVSAQPIRRKTTGSSRIISISATTSLTKA